MATIKGWFTMNGVHIPIMEGQSKADAAKAYMNSKHGKDVARLSSKKYTKKKETSNKKQYTEAEVNQALTRFTSNEYENIRKASNGEKITESKLDIKNRKVEQIDITNKYKEYANAIEQHIANSPKYNGEIYRGIQLNNKEGIEYSKNNLKVGKEIDMKGISSWSTKESVAQEFAERSSTKNYNIIYKVNNKSGVDIENKSLSKREKEVLHSANSKFKVTKVKETVKDEKDEYTGIVHKTTHIIKVELEEVDR